MPKPNIVLIVLDTLREDHAQGLEPLTQLGFVKYENVYAPAPWTLPSHASMFTGLYPSEHGIHERRGTYGVDLAALSRIRMAKLDGGILGELKAAGYTTYLISANPIISQDFGFNADVQYLVDPVTTKTMTVVYTKYDYMFAKHGSKLKVALELLRESKYGMALEAAKLYLERRLRLIYRLPRYLSERYVMKKGGDTIIRLVNHLKPQEPYFLCINVMEAHSPYTRKDLVGRRQLSYVGEWLATGQVNPKALELWRNYPLHAQEATKIAIEIVHQIKQKGNWDNTLVIITSDHGELLGDGGLGHIYSLLDGNLRVPLYVKYPGKSKKQRGLLSLTEIPRIIDPNIDEIGRSVVFAETHGIGDPEPFGKWKRYINSRHYHHKIRVISAKRDFIYNKTEDKVEKVFREYTRDIGKPEIL
ncbi:sulfatase [Thermoproteus uzoniensis 768-20]|uniref:Sulfatase n=1 Tax=Thermoproteus uzoniensis (strain 768-20) TaxID=999630 RepID=F2L0N5_THEU7|nr:sulfatase-like hydrolase/transferase [Thermoproteus uzoniensis]AEA11514.1 sulfatase [Thermoproteus uzoniensis 768-20]